MEVTIYMDHAIIEGQTVRRPSYISRKQWMEAWEDATYRRNYGCNHHLCPKATERGEWR